MAPKKKGNKKGNDDWEAELGETPDPLVVASQEAKDNNDGAKDGADDDTGSAGGGLLAALKKNKKNKKAKGKHVEEDFVDGEDLPGVNGHAEPDTIVDLGNKVAPEEATADDLFTEGPAIGKGGKGKPGKKDEPPKEDADEDVEGGGLKSKKEKEKEKKEREKQRKKEQVRLQHGHSNAKSGYRTRRLIRSSYKGREEENPSSNSSSREKGRTRKTKGGSHIRAYTNGRHQQGREEEVASSACCSPEATGSPPKTTRRASQARR